MATAGLVLLDLSIQPDIGPDDLAFGAVLGLGLGLIASQLLNLILSLVAPDQTAKTAGLNSTFEQLGNAIGVALIGALMLGALSFGLQKDIDASPVIPLEAKDPLNAAMEDGVSLVSNSHLEETLTAVGADEALETEILDIYALARTGDFKARGRPDDLLCPDSLDPADVVAQTEAGGNRAGRRGRRRLAARLGIVTVT